MILFVHGTQYTVSERSFFLQNSPTDLIFTTTLGNIAQTGTMCYPVGANEDVGLRVDWMELLCFIFYPGCVELRAEQDIVNKYSVWTTSWFVSLSKHSATSERQLSR
jgi:hypothetical protein